MVGVKSLPSIRAEFSGLMVRMGWEGLLRLPHYFVDEDGDELLYSATTNAPEVVEVAIVNDTLLSSLTSSDIWGTASISVTAQDEQGEVSQDFELSATVPPVISDSMPDYLLRVDHSVEINLDDYFSDLDTDDLEYTAEDKPRFEPPRVADFRVNGSILEIEVSHIPARTLVTVKADDGLGLVQQSFWVEVDPPPPIWKEDFDSTLEGWTIDPRVNESSAKIENGTLRMDLLSSDAYHVVSLDSAAVDLDDDWTLSVRAMVEDRAFCGTFAAMTGDSINRGWMNQTLWRGASKAVLYNYVWEEDEWEHPWVTAIRTVRFGQGNRYDLCGSEDPHDGVLTVRYDWVAISPAKEY